jgi:hypothetical protein
MTFINLCRLRQYVSVLILIFLSGSSESFSTQQTSCKVGKRQNRYSMALYHYRPITNGNKIRYSSIQYLAEIPTEHSSTEKEDSGGEAAESLDVFTSTEKSSSTIKNSKTKRLLTIPLFIKFVAVLLIKFITDLVVFPVLFLYRMAHNAKQRLLRLFKNDTEAPSGDNISS